MTAEKPRPIVPSPAVHSSNNFSFHTEVRVRLPETDAMGIVFHGNYFTFLEVGRVDYLRNLGLAEGIRPIRDFENVVVAAHLDFKSPARLDDPLIIDVRVREIRASSFTFDFRIRHKITNRVTALGYTVHCAIDKEFKPISVPESFRKIVKAYEGWS
ncbi:MAG: acyl-CoA thioesterase [Planctomycetota bacterium]